MARHRDTEYDQSIALSHWHPASDTAAKGHGTTTIISARSAVYPIPSPAASTTTADPIIHGSSSTGDLALQRSLKPRHLQMIAIGGVIGTGLFLGTASDLQTGGPASLLLSYIVMGSLLFAVMTALGEMVVQFPLPGGQFALAGRFVSPELGFAMGWLYWFHYVVVLPAEISAAAVLVTYWTGDSATCGAGADGAPAYCSSALWVALMLAAVCAINFAGTGVYGEMEFWFCSLKVVTIVGLIILGIVISAGGGPDHTPIGFKYWYETGGFVQFAGIPGAAGRFLAFYRTLISAAFAFFGSEIVAIAAAETADPRRAVPGAIRVVWVRLVLFYGFSALLIGLLVSPADPSLNLESTAAKSPFVIAIKNAGITTLPSILNAVLLSSAWSAGCADMYVSSRALYGLVVRRQAPRWLGRTRRDGLPYVCVGVSALFSLVSFMAASDGQAGIVFGWFANMTSECGIISWFAILWTYTRWYKGLQVQGIDRTELLAYRAPFQPWLSYYGMAICVVAMVFGGFSAFVPTLDVSTFITTYFPIPFFAAMFFGYKVLHPDKSGMIPYEDMDFVRGSSFDMPSEPPRKGLWHRFADKI